MARQGRRPGRKPKSVKREEALARHADHCKLSLHDQLAKATERHQNWHRKGRKSAPVSKEMLRLQQQIEAQERSMSKVGPERPHESEAASETHKKDKKRDRQRRR